ncbi:hypothetical protein GOARA_046_00210 [Gordonia araii NBRC 100433]|uniref:DoxX family protein n=1 Tax=Gordonia araii NBRC 100433 TaxID=1073574 RepID=G7H1M7_9ACTN|nr:DoxX family protein [Gordonia araii]NNG98279.1 DoxX family protein [Gordonia araii NBRC 100433]GAB09752.1 hypothetical protein GOARA_046_00210 [Gordonia araii NBRC 100433]
MNVFLWIVASVLAAVFLFAGSAKLAQPKDKLVASGMGWADDVDPNVIKGIGLVEVLGAIGLIVPALTDILPGLVPWAATGLAIVMLGAIGVHARRKEWPLIGVNIVILALALIVMWGRFSELPF